MQTKTQSIVDSIFKRQQKNKAVSSIFLSAQNPPKEERTSVQKKILPLGIDIGTNSFKIAQILPAKDGFVLSDLVIEEFSRELISNPEKKKELIPQILKMILEKHRLQLPCQCYASLSSSLIQIKTLRLAPMPKEEIDSAVRWEMQQTSQRKLEDISYDYMVFEEEVLNKEATEILVFVSEKKDILEYIQILNAAGINPLAIEPDSVSIISCLNFMNQINPNEIAIVLEMGAGVSTLNIIENRQLRLVRAVALNCNTFSSAIKDCFSISLEEAEDKKRVFDCLELEGANANILKQQVDNLILDIEHTFKYYSYQLTRSRVGWFNRIILSGGCALLKNIDKYLSKHLEVPVEIADPLRRLSISQEVSNNFPALKNIAPRLSACIGLALRGQIEEQ